MSSEQDIDEQRKILDVHRRTLAIYLQRLALVGLAHASPEVVHGIDEARKQILLVKNNLRELGGIAEDLVDDEVPNSHLGTQSTSTLKNYYRTKNIYLSKSIKHIRILILLMAVFVASTIIYSTPIIPCNSSFATEDWSSFSAPFIDINTIATNPKENTIIYAGTLSEGIYRSNNYGRHWVQVFPRGRVIRQVIVDPENTTTIYAATDRGLLKSIDSG